MRQDSVKPPNLPTGIIYFALKRESDILKILKVQVALGRSPFRKTGAFLLYWKCQDSLCSKPLGVSRPYYTVSWQTGVHLKAFLCEIEMQLAEIKTVTMTSLEIAELTRKRHDHIIRDIREMMDAVKDAPDLGHQLNQGLTEHKDARNYTSHFDLNRFVAELLITGYDVARRARVLNRLLELELKQAPKLPNNYIEALQALLVSEQEKERIAIERDLAIEKKAEIGSRREATAMATASNATQRANRLEVELDKSKQYATIKRMSLLYHGIKFNWRDLKDASNEMGLPPIDVYDANYGTVKGYHADVWLAIYSLEII